MPKRLFAVFAAVAIATGIVLAVLALTGRGPWSSGSAGLPEVCADASRPVTLGPRVGAVTNTTAKVWMRACRRTNIAVQYQPTGGDWGAAPKTAAIATDPKADNTAVVTITGLAEGATYDYRTVVDGKQPAEPLAGRFHTLPTPGSEQPLSFVFGADIREDYFPHDAFDQIVAVDPAFALFMGDQIYVDPQLPPETPFFDAHSKTDYERVYQRAWSAEPAYRAMLSKVATYLMWSDHEILNDWDRGAASPYPWARAAYEEYQQSANPRPAAPGELYYTFQAGEADFFVLDERTYRAPESSTDSPYKTMLGTKQKADLKTWLLESQAKFKFIVSDVMWSDHALHENEAWKNYTMERNEIFDYIVQNHISGVVLFSGDEHWTGVFRLQPWNLYEFSITPLAGYVGLATSDTSPDILFKLGRENTLGQLQLANTFGYATIEGTGCDASLTIRVINAAGENRYELRLSQADLSRATAMSLSSADYCAALAAGSLDSDNDGCTDAQERGPDKKLGGHRDPSNPWDFYDVNRNGVVDFYDAAVVAASLGKRSGDPGYDRLYDRSPPRAGASALELGPPDGVIDQSDLFAVVDQMGDSCRPPPP